MKVFPIAPKRITMLAFVFSLAALLLGLLNRFHPSKTVVTFDEKQISRRFVAQLSHQYKSEDEIDTITRHFASALKKSLNEFAKTNQVIVLRKEGVLGSGIDKTKEISRLVAKNMRTG